MSVYIYKNDQQTGPFEERKILEWLKSGKLSGEDFAYRKNDDFCFVFQARRCCVSTYVGRRGRCDELVSGLYSNGE